MKEYAFLMLIVAIIIILVLNKLGVDVFKFVTDSFSKNLDETVFIDNSTKVNFDNVDAKKVVAEAMQKLPVSEFHKISSMDEMEISNFLSKELNNCKSLQRYSAQINRLSTDVAKTIKTASPA